jgi:hypothetical protein
MSSTRSGDVVGARPSAGDRPAEGDAVLSELALSEAALANAGAAAPSSDTVKTVRLVLKKLFERLSRISRGYSWLFKHYLETLGSVVVSVDRMEPIADGVERARAQLGSAMGIAQVAHNTVRSIPPSPWDRLGPAVLVLPMSPGILTDLKSMAEEYQQHLDHAYETLDASGRGLTDVQEMLSRLIAALEHQISSLDNRPDKNDFDRFLLTAYGDQLELMKFDLNERVIAARGTATDDLHYLDRCRGLVAGFLSQAVIAR